MKHRWILLGMGLLAAAAVLVRAEGDPPADTPLVIYATNQSRGNLEPCECVVGMAGGFARRLSYLGRESKRVKQRAVVDLGDLSGKAFDPRILEAKTAAALEIARRGGLSCGVVGELDLRLGVKKLKALAKSAGVTLLGANLLDATGAAAFPAKLVVQVKGSARPILFVGVLDPELGDASGELTLGDPADAVRAALETGPTNAWRVILLHGSAKLGGTLAKLPGVDLVLCGHDQEKPTPLRAVGKARLLEVVRDARSVARVVLGDPLRAEHVALDGRVPDDRWTRARIDRYYQTVAGIPQEKRQPPEGGDLVGVERCADCHEAQVKLFEQTKHHGVHERVLKKDPKRARLPECLTCHVTGYGYEGGFTDMKNTPYLAEVGCESCHGVGGDHARAGGTKGFGVKAGFPDAWKPTCLGCHDASNSPGFDFAKGMAKIKHWGTRKK